MPETPPPPAAAAPSGQDVLSDCSLNLSIVRATPPEMLRTARRHEQPSSNPPIVMCSPWASALGSGYINDAALADLPHCDLMRTTSASRASAPATSSLWSNATATSTCSTGVTNLVGKAPDELRAEAVARGVKHLTAEDVYYGHWIDGEKKKMWWDMNGPHSSTVVPETPPPPPPLAPSEQDVLSGHNLNLSIVRATPPEMLRTALQHEQPSSSPPIVMCSPWASALGSGYINDAALADLPHCALMRPMSASRNPTNNFSK